MVGGHEEDPREGHCNRAGRAAVTGDCPGLAEQEPADRPGLAEQEPAELQVHHSAGRDEDVAAGGADRAAPGDHWD